MMAAAMTRRKSTQRDCRELAGKKSVFDRVIPGQSLERIQATTLDISDVTARFEFREDRRGRPCVTTQASCTVALPCQWCLESVAVQISWSVAAQLAADETEAASWEAADQREPMVKAEDPITDDDPASEKSGQALEAILRNAPIVVMAGGVFDETLQIEDELLLQLPQQVCTDDNCERRPDTSFPAQGLNPSGNKSGAIDTSEDDGALGNETAERENPFAVLKDLKFD